MHRYDEIVDLVRKRIQAGSLKPGERLPSVRQLSELTGFSTVTIHRGYEILESQGLCVARPRSGFFVAADSAIKANFPNERPRPADEPLPIDELPDALLLSWRRRGVEAFGAFYPSADLYDRASLDLVLRKVLRRGPGRVRGWDAPEGATLLRQEIARRLAQRGIIVRHQEILITGSGMMGFNLSLDALSRPGDVVLVESPSYFPMLASLKRRGLRVVEVYSHPQYGTDPEQFEYILKHNEIRVALMMATHHYPTGITYSEETMRRIVQAATDHGVTILENDMFGDLSYSNVATKSLKQFDSRDTVIQFGSFTNNLAAGYGVGWVVAGRQIKVLLETQFLSGNDAGDGMMQHAIGEFLAEHSLDRTLRTLRNELSLRMRQGLQLIAGSFPPGCSVTQPDGGFMVWVRGPAKFNAQSAAVQAVKQGFSFLPGPVFSAEKSFHNFMALNLSFPWTDERKNALEQLGKLLQRAT